MTFWERIKNAFLGEDEGDYYPLNKPRTEEPLKKEEVAPVKKTVRLKTKRNTAPRKKTSKKKKTKKL